MTKFLINEKHNNIVNETEYRAEVRKLVTDSLKRCQKHKMPSIDDLFEDVYDKLPAHLVEQRAELREHIRKNKDKYTFLEKF